MADRTVTGAVESDAEPEAVLEVLQDARRLPEWAPLFADRVETADGNTWTAIKGETSFPVEVAVGETSQTVDYLLEAVPGVRGGAYLRVLPRYGGGCVVVMTLPVRPGNNPEQVRAVIQQELTALVRVSAT